MTHRKSTKEVSIIIPTYNRKQMLRQTLDAISSQTYDIKNIEVVVVSDGCKDGTLEMLRSYPRQFELRILEQARKGPGSARNYGATYAVGKLLIFIDDDVVPEPQLIEEHVKTHNLHPAHVVIGYYPVATRKNADFLEIQTRSWWGAIFHPMFQQGHRFKYSNLLSGNFSIEKKIFSSVGYFNSDLLVHEDFELGIRLIKAKILFKFNQRAAGKHHTALKLDGLFERKFQEGRSWAMMVNLHRDTLPDLDLTRFKNHNSLTIRTIYNLAFRLPKAGDIIISTMRSILNFLEYFKLRKTWYRLLTNFLVYWWLSGIAAEVCRENTPTLLIKNIRKKIDGNIPSTELDLSKGIEYSEELLDKERPRSATIRYNEHTIGIIPGEPGAEPIRGSHLRPILAGELAAPLLIALATNGVIVSSSESDLLKLSNSIRKKSIYGGIQTSDKIWLDRSHQWKPYDLRGGTDEFTFWEIQGRIRELELKKGWVEKEWSVVKNQAEEKEQTIRDQRTAIKKLEGIIL